MVFNKSFSTYSYFGGNFGRSFYGQTLLSHVAVWDGQSLTQVGSGLNGTVNALVMNGTSNLFIGGYFSGSGSLQLSNIGKNKLRKFQKMDLHFELSIPNWFAKNK